MTFPAGTEVGPYRIERLLGQGGMGAVYSAWHAGLQRRVALKVLHNEQAGSEEAAKRFAREAVAASRVRHPGVVEVYDANVQDGTPWIAMELLEGETLASLLGRRPLAPGEAVWLADKTLGALAVVHEEHLVHRDLKPENLFLERVRGEDEARLKILDFGIATGKSAGLDTVTQTGGTVGTVHYLSPEQARGASLDARSDLYALSVVLFEALAGERPFTAASFGELAVKLNTEEARSLGELAAELPASLIALVDRGLKRDPQDRWQTAAAMREAVRASGVASLPLIAPRASERPPPAAPDPALAKTQAEPGAAATEASIPKTLAMSPAMSPALGPAVPAQPAMQLLAAPPRPSSPLRWIVLGVVGLVAALGALAGWALYEPTIELGGPSRLVAPLRATTWEAPPDETGYRSLASPFEGAAVRVAALGEEGTLAIGLTQGLRHLLLSWREGSLRVVPIESPATAEAFPLGPVSAIAIDREGRVYAGTRHGRLVTVMPDGSVHARVVQADTTVIGLSVSPVSDEIAVLLSGGDIRLGHAPLTEGRLDPLMLPVRARVRSLGHLPDGALMIGGDGGQVLFRRGGEWEAEPIAAPNDVRAVGFDRHGRPLAADSRGLVHAYLGSRWRSIGDVPYAPLAIQDTPRWGITAVGPDGRIHATLDGDAFVELPGYEPPVSEQETLFGAQIAGDVVAMWRNEAAFVFDEELWRSDRLASEAAIDPSTCAVHRALRRSPSGPAAILVCGETLAGITAGRLAPITEASHDGLSHPAQVWLDLDADLTDTQSEWAAGALVRVRPGTGLHLERWAPAAARWEPLWSAPQETTLSARRLAAHAVEGGSELWLVDDERGVWRASVRAGAPVEMARLGRVELPEVLDMCESLDVDALGGGLAVVTACAINFLFGDGEPRLYAPPGTTPAPLEDLRPWLDYGALASVGPYTLGWREGRLLELDAQGAPQFWTVTDDPGGQRSRSLSLAQFALGPQGELTLSLGAGRNASLLRCRNRTCDRVDLPAGVRPMGVLPVEGGLLVIGEEGLGVLARQE